MKFATNKADILPGKDSEAVLFAVLDVLKKHPEITKVSVEGHTDSSGEWELNRTLGEDRAGSVVRWLIAHGVDKGRLASKGFGPSRPIDDNATPEGRRNNRRVEFIIVEDAK